MIRNLLLIAILWVTLPSMSETLIARNGDNWLRLNDTPCTSAASLAQIKAEWQGRFRAAFARVGGADFAACWTELDGVVFVLYEDSDRATFPLSAFKPVPTI